MIKKHLFFALAATALLSACSNEADIKAPEVIPTDAEQVINLMVSNAGDGLTTRSGRELYSSEANQDIDIVKIIITESTIADGAGGYKIVATTKLTDWKGADSNEYGRDGATAQGRRGSFKLQGSEKISDAGSYNVYAFGYSMDSDYSNLATIIDGIDKGALFNENVVLSLADGKKVEEIFAGSAKLSIDTNKAGYCEVTLNRQVAGTFGYFINIPYEEGVSKLVLKSYAYSSLNNQLVLGQFVNSDLTNNGDNTTTNVVNGWGGTKSNNGTSSAVIYEIDLKAWFAAGENQELTATPNNLIDATNWATPEEYKDVAFKNESVFGGTFMIPFANVSGKNSLVLELTDATYKTLRTWNIKLATGDNQLKDSYEVCIWNGNIFPEATGNDETATCYSILRNHLYTVGEKVCNKKQSADPETTNPEPDDSDEPQDLSKTQELTLQVNDNWEVIHKMELE